MKRSCGFLRIMVGLLFVLGGKEAVFAAEPLTKETFESRYAIVTKAEDTKIILDTDMVFLNDDAYALFALLQADKLGYLELLGVTTAGGNCLVASATYDTLTQLEYVGRPDVRVFAGDDEPLNGFLDIQALQRKIGKMSYVGTYRYLEKYTKDYLKAAELGLTRTSLPSPTTKPQIQSAVDFMIEQVHKYPGKVTIMAIAGLGNIAKAIEKDPDFTREAAGIVYMGGVFDVPGEALPAVEINWWYDPVAADICLNAGWKKQVVVPHDASVTCLKGLDVYERYKAKNTTKITELIVNTLAPIYENGKVESLLNCWDPITVAVLLCPEIIVRQEMRQVAVDTRMGMTYGSSFGWKEGTGPEVTPECQVVFQVKRDKFWDFMSDLYSVGD